MKRIRAMVRNWFVSASVVLLAAGCSSGGRQASAPSAPSASRPAAEQPGAPAAPSAPPSGGGQPEAASTPAASPQTQASAPEVKACDLLTKEEVEEIIGQKIDAVEVQEGYGNCIYYKKEKFFGDMMNVPVVTVGYTTSEVQARWDELASMPKSEVVTGVGDGAIWSPDLGFFVSRVKGGLLMIAAKDRDMAVSLAKKAVARIQP